MRTTNRQALPEGLYRALTDDAREPTPGRYSVTELLKPVREIALTRLRWGELERDAADMVPALLGTATHALIEGHTPDGAAAEEPLEATVGGITIAGRMDLYDETTGDVVDYKTTTAAKVQRGDYLEWMAQTAGYAWLLWESRGVRAKGRRIHALIRDWSKVRAATVPNYPQSPIVTLRWPVADSDIEEAGRAMLAKAREAEAVVAGAEPPECSDEERWYTGTKWAVYRKAGDARAARVLDAKPDESEVPEGGRLEERRGEYLKCRYYCPVARMCGKGEKEND